MSIERSELVGHLPLEGKAGMGWALRGLPMAKTGTDHEMASVLVSARLAIR